MNRSITFFHLSGSLIMASFQNCWGLLAKYSSRCVFISLTEIWDIYHGQNFLTRETSNNRMEQGKVERPNQTVIVFVLRPTQRMRFCVVAMKNDASSVRQFWPFFCHGGFQLIELIAIFVRIWSFHLEEGARSTLHLTSPTKCRKELPSDEVQALRQSKVCFP